MDVHGTKLARTLFTIATGVERGACSSSQALDGFHSSEENMTIESSPRIVSTTVLVLR